MRVARLCRLALPATVVLAAICGVLSPAGAQDPAKIEVVPNIQHSDIVLSVAFSPDGTRLLSGSSDNTIRLWDVATGKLLRIFRGHSASVESVAFSPDGARLLSGSSDNTIRLWDAATGKLLRTFEGHHAAVYSVAFAPHGARVLSGCSDNAIRLWDAATGKLLRTFKRHSAPVLSVAFSVDGSRVLSGSMDATIKLWDPATGKLLRTFEGHHAEVQSIVFSHDGTRVLSGGMDHTVRLWDAATGKLLRTFEGQGSAWSVAFAPKGGSLLSANGDRIGLWDATTGKLVRTFEGHSGDVESVTFSPDGAHVLSGGRDGTLRLWDASTGVLLRTVGGHSNHFSSVAFSPDGTRVVLGNWDKTISLWDTNTATLRTFKGHSHWVTSVAFSPDGAQVLSGSLDRMVNLWDGTMGDLLRTFKGHSDWVTSVAFSPDGARVLSGSHDNTIRLWDTATGVLLRTLKVPDRVTSVAFSPNGARILSGSSDDTIRLWDAVTGKVLRTFKGDLIGVTSVAFSPDGARVLSGSIYHTVRLWDAATGTLLRTFEGHSDRVLSVAFSPDGARVLSGGTDHTVRLWDAATGTLLRTLEGHSGTVESVAFSPDGRRVVSGSYDTTARIWDAVTGARLATFTRGSDDQWLAITAAGIFAASPKGAEMLSVVRGLEVYSVTQFYDQLYRTDLVAEALKGDPELKYRGAAKDLNLETILDSGKEPRIEHLEKKTERAGDTVTLAVRIVDQGGGVGARVAWRVNGQTRGRTEPDELKGRQTFSTDAAILTEALRIDPAKDNIVELVAYNGKGLLATRPLRINVPKVGLPTTGDPPRLHVLAIGVDKYRIEGRELKYAVRDAIEFSKAMETVGGTLFAKVLPKVLKDHEVTEQAIAAEFERIGANAKVGDAFVLYLAGHGAAPEGKYYYYPQPFDLNAGHTLPTHGIGQDKWQTWLAKVGHVERSLIVLDTCYAGAAVDPLSKKRGFDRAIETALDKYKNSTGQSLIAASRQAAAEGYNGHGVLTYAVLEALRRKDGAGEKHSVGAAGLGAYVRERVPQITDVLFGERQYPIIDIKADFPLGFAVLEADATKAIPRTPTHVLIRGERVRKRPAADAPVVRELAARFQVRVIEAKDGWAEIARDGERLGFVPEEALLGPIQ